MCVLQTKPKAAQPSCTPRPTGYIMGWLPGRYSSIDYLSCVNKPSARPRGWNSKDVCDCVWYRGSSLTSAWMTSSEITGLIRMILKALRNGIHSSLDPLKKLKANWKHSQSDNHFNHPSWHHWYDVDIFKWCHQQSHRVWRCKQHQTVLGQCQIKSFDAKPTEKKTLQYHEIQLPRCQS